MKIIEKIMVWYVKHSKRFQGQLWQPYEDDSGKGFICPRCGEPVDESWKICEECFYPLPFNGSTKKK